MTILPIFLRPILGGEASGVCVFQDSDVYLHIDREQLTHEAQTVGEPSDLLGFESSRARHAPVVFLTHEILTHVNGGGERE